MRSTTDRPKTPTQRNPQQRGINPLAGLDRVIHEPARLMIMAVLSVVDSGDFIFLMNQTGLSWGNLSAHIARLEKAGYIEVVKSFNDRRPNTMLRLTMKGREAFRQYRKQMKFVLDDLLE